MEFKDWTPVMAAVITGVSANIVTNHLTNRRATKEKRMQNYLEQLKSVYAPIYSTMIFGIHPGDGYEELDQHQFRRIEELVDGNITLVDAQLNAIVWSFKEELAFNYRYDFISQEQRFVSLDEDGALLRHVEYKFEWLKKRLHLPYDKRVFWPYSMLKKSNRKWRSFQRWCRKILRKIRRNFKERFLNESQ